MRKRGYQEKETICWGCQNYSSCSWADGIPVKGWKATPTEFVDSFNGDTYITHSFLVERCPQFKADKKRRTTVKGIGTIIGKGEATVLRIFANKGVEAVADALKEKGYKLHVYKMDKRRQFYLEKIK